MTREEAIRILDPETTIEALVEIEYYAGFSGQTAKVQAVSDACEVVVAALRTQKSPCAACGYGGKHLDAPPCTTCPAHPKLESNLKVVESTEQSEAVTKCNDLYDEDGGEIFNRTESDTVKVAGSDQFARNLHDVASNQQVTEALHPNGFSDSEPLIASKNQVTSDWINVKDALPKDNAKVLVCTRAKKMCVARWSARQERFVTSGNVTVTHWQPLPDFPKEEV